MERRCSEKCGYLSLHRWLEAPLLPSDYRREALVDERVAALKAGNI